MATRRTTLNHSGPTVPPELPFRTPTECRVEFLSLDLRNPRLQTGEELDSDNETDVVATLADIAALDELVTSICTNTYLHLEPMIVHRPAASLNSKYVVLEGNRRLAAIRVIQDRALAAELGIRVPAEIAQKVLDSIKTVLVYRVEFPEDARAFIGFKHINGPQRWDAYAKARYVTDWYLSAKGQLSVADIASRMGDNNSTLRSYIYAVLILDQAERTGTWSLGDRPTVRGRFAFSHFYTALGRDEFQQFLGLTKGWSDSPPKEPIAKGRLSNLRELLSYLYGMKSDDRQSLIRSQNPDLRDIGLAIANDEARLVLRNRGTLDDARDALKAPSAAFLDAVIAAQLKLKRAIELLPKYTGGDRRVDEFVSDICDQAEVLKALTQKKSSRRQGTDA
jgi:hypothetical protein